MASPATDFDWWSEFVDELSRPDVKCECGHALGDSHVIVMGGRQCYWCDCGHQGTPTFPPDIPAWLHTAWARVVWGVGDTMDE